MDIDIDIQNVKIDTIFKNCRHASRIFDNEIKCHPVGIYFQNIPLDPKTKFAAIPYEESEKFGFYKVDFLHLTTLDRFQNRRQMLDVLKLPVNWESFKNQNIVSKLPQINKSFDIINAVAPKSIIELADCLTLIRPAKRKYLQRYLLNRENIRPLLYQKDEGEKYSFKKGHAIAYAQNILIELHFINT